MGATPCETPAAEYPRDALTTPLVGPSISSKRFDVRGHVYMALGVSVGIALSAIASAATHLWAQNEIETGFNYLAVVVLASIVLVNVYRTARFRRLVECWAGQLRKRETRWRKIVGMAQNAIRALADYKRVEEVLARARHETEAANRVKSEFLAQISHEIRTPMTAILGFADILLEHLHGAEGRAAADSIKRNGQYLLDILDTILDLYKIEAGKLPIEKAPCSPVSIVAEVAALMRARVQEHNLGLKMEFAGSIPETIATDPVRLRQVLVNLVSNAVKFTESGGVRIVTHLQPRPGQPPLLQFDVIDTGVGISEEQLKNIFQPFARADGSDGQWVASTGLGLAISQRLAALLGGSITARSEFGEGTTFSLTIDPGPLGKIRLLDYPAEVAVGGHTPLTPAPERLPRLTGRVLLVEDVPDIQRLVAYMLRKAGAEVRLAENGQVAVEMVLSARSTPDHEATPSGEPYDVILMDMQMPILDGYQATRQLRLLGYAGPIVALTAHAMSQDRQKCLDAGCDDYMSKPIERRTLLETVARHLGRRPVLV